MERRTLIHPPLEAVIESLGEPLALIDAAGTLVTASTALRSLIGIAADDAGTIDDIIPAIASLCAGPAEVEAFLGSMKAPDAATFARERGGTLTVRLASPGGLSGAVLWRLEIAEPPEAQHHEGEIVDAVEDATIALDPDFRILSMNEAMQKIMEAVGPGRRTQGKILWEVFPEYVGSATYHTYHLTMRDRVPRRVLELGADRLFECTAYPTPNGIFACLRDVTDEQSFDPSADGDGARFAPSSRLGMIIINAEGRLIDVDQVFCDTTGYEHDELLGSSYRRLIHPDDEPRTAARFRSLIEADPTSRAMELRLLHKDGGTRWVVAWAEATIGRSDPPHTAVHCHDVTERKRALEALAENHHQLISAYEQQRRTNQELRAVDEMKNAFLSAVSHDLRTPLTSVLGLASTLLHRGSQLDDATRTTLTQRLWSNAERLSQLLTDLLDLDRLQRGILTASTRAIDLADLVATTLERSDLPNSHRIELDLQPVEAEIDPAMVERILENLVINAIRHTRTGTRIKVETRAENGHALLAVSDAGAGVPVQARDRIFHAFEQGPGPATHDPGLGIGLSLVARFVALHDGKVWLEDPPDGGARFCVSLPVRRSAKNPTTSTTVRR